MHQFYKMYHDVVITHQVGARLSNGENTHTYDEDGLMLFSFDKQKIYNFFKDYPDKLSFEEKEIFDKENPYWQSL